MKIENILNEFKQIVERRFTRPFKGDESRFILLTAAKVTAIPLVVCLFITFQIWILVYLDLIFFQSHITQLTGFAEVYYDFIFGELVDNVLYIGLFFIALFFIGAYLGELLLRPFESLGDYCKKVVDKKEEIYQLEVFSDLRILTRFSDYFFTFMSAGRDQGEIRPGYIPQMYSGIHRPFFDKVFFFHFCLFLCFIAIIVSVFTYSIAIDLHGNIVEFAINTLPNKNVAITYFLNQQSNVLLSVVIVSICILTVMYIVLAFHLYGKVSDAAFGIFSTMRSFLKGQYTARVHMIGHRYLRSQTRSINHYLDYLEKSFTKKKDDQ